MKANAQRVSEGFEIRLAIATVDLGRGVLDAFGMLFAASDSANAYVKYLESKVAK